MTRYLQVAMTSCHPTRRLLSAFAGVVKTTLSPTLMIENFQGEWQQEWFSYTPGQWPRSTHKMNDPIYAPPENSKLVIEVKGGQKNELVVLLDHHAAAVPLESNGQWQRVVLEPSHFRDFADQPRLNCKNIKTLKLGAAERLKNPKRGGQGSRIAGGKWQGPVPIFRNLSWQIAN